MNTGLTLGVLAKNQEEVNCRYVGCEPRAAWVHGVVEVTPGLGASESVSRDAIVNVGQAEGPAKSQTATGGERNAESLTLTSP